VLPTPVDQGFTDLAHLPALYQDAIDQLAVLGITSGTGPGTFGPDLVVTRQQMASFLARALTTLGSGSPTTP
jgi:hypothetical protein